MKKIKTGLFVIILLFFCLIIFQNKGYFFSKYSMLIDLKIPTWQWAIPGFTNIGYLGLFFCLGFLIAGYMGVSTNQKAKKVFKLMDQELDSYNEQIVSLKAELDKFNKDPYASAKNDNNETKPPEQTQST